MKTDREGTFDKAAVIGNTVFALELYASCATNRATCSFTFQHFNSPGDDIRWSREPTAEQMSERRTLHPAGGGSLKS